MGVRPGLARVVPWVVIGTAGACAATFGSQAAAASTTKGAEVYALHCLNCHGSRGRGELAGVPDIARGNALMRSDADLVASILIGRGAMPGFLGIIRERELYDLVAYMRLLR